MVPSRSVYVNGVCTVLRVRDGQSVVSCWGGMKALGVCRQPLNGQDDVGLQKADPSSGTQPGWGGGGRHEGGGVPQQKGLEYTMVKVLWSRWK